MSAPVIHQARVLPHHKFLVRVLGEAGSGMPIPPTVSIRRTREGARPGPHKNTHPLATIIINSQAHGKLSAALPGNCAQCNQVAHLSPISSFIPNERDCLSGRAACLGSFQFLTPHVVRVDCFHSSRSYTVRDWRSTQPAYRGSECERRKVEAGN